MATYFYKFSGYGTYEDNSVIYSSLVGTVEKTNKYNNSVNNMGQGYC